MVTAISVIFQMHGNLPFCVRYMYSKSWLRWIYPYTLLLYNTDTTPFSSRAYFCMYIYLIEEMFALLICHKVQIGTMVSLCHGVVVCEGWHHE